MAEPRDTTKWVRWLQFRAYRRRAVAELCAFYEPLVKAMAQRYRQTTPGAELDELEQTARLALCEACLTFEPRRWKRRRDGLGRLFTQHAVWSLRHALSKYLTTLPNPVRLPSVVADRIPKMRREALRLAHELGREPTLEELATATGMPKRKYQDTQMEMIALMRAYDDEAPITLNDGDVIASAAPTPEDVVIAKEDYRALRRQRRTHE
jgi:RNA polymerase nonessential primary-like sigma factor